MVVKGRKLVKTILLAIILLNNAFAFAQNKIAIKIDGENYEREYPKTLEEAYSVIDALVDLEVTADTKVTELKKSCEDEIQKYEIELAKLKSQVEDLKKEVATAKSDTKVVNKAIDDYSKTNTRFTTFVGIGPVISDNVFGSHVEILAEYRLLRNFHIGGSIFLNNFNNNSSPFNFGCGLFVGYSIY